MLRRADSGWQVVAWGLIVLAIAYAVGAGGAGSYGINDTLSRIVGSAILVAALAVWLVAAVRVPFWRPRTRLVAGFAASLAALLIALLGSAQPRLGYDYLAYAILLTGAYFVAQRLFAHPYFGPRLGSLAVLLGIGLSSVYVVLVAVKWVALWVSLGRIIAPPLRPGFESLGLGDPSGLAAVLLLLLLAAMSHLGVDTPTRRLVAFTHAALTLIAIFLTGSRSAWVALAFTLVLIGALWLLNAERRALIWNVARARGFRTATLGISIATLIAAVVFSRAVAGRIGEPAGDTRTAFAHASLAMFESDPATGVGPGMWVVDRIRYTQAPDVDYYIPHAHNLVLQTVAELGLVGVAAGLVIAAVVLLLIRTGLGSADPLARRLGWGIVFASVFLIVHQMFSLYANMPALWICFAFLVARLDALSTADQPDMTRHAFIPVGIASALLVISAAVWLGFSERAALVNDAAVAAANDGNWPAAEAASRLAFEQDPAMPPYALSLGLAEARIGKRVEALSHIRASANIDDFPIAWLDVARLELDLRNRGAAREALDRSLRLGYQHPQVGVGAALMYLELGDHAEAVSALAGALVVAPALASDPWWAKTGRRDLLEEALTAAIPIAPPESGYRLALEGGRSDVAAAVVAAMSEEQRAMPELVIRAWAGDRDAFEAIHALAFDNPLDYATVTMCRRLALHARAELDPPAAWHCDDAGAPDIPLVIRIDAPDYGEWAPVPGLPGPDASVHVVYVYRRLAPFAKLVPGVPVVVPKFR